jgi:hypothetical protein
MELKITALSNYKPGILNNYIRIVNVSIPKTKVVLVLGNL